jgi:3-dehydroquinate dehydratase-1
MEKKILTAAAFALAGMVTFSAVAAESYVRPVPSQPIVMGKTVLGDTSPVICSPLVAKTRDAVISEAKTVKDLNPDMVEVRADFWNFIENTDEAIAALRDIRKIIGDTPILLTVRIASERGAKEVSDKAKFDFYKKAAAEKLPNLIDVELAYGKDFIQKFKKEISGSKIPLVVAYHDLKGTPAKEEIIRIMEKEVDAGGDVAKIVVKPLNENDVLTFLGGTLGFRNAHPQYPIIASASGSIGRITRLAGGLFGIDLTFASGVKGSNPWQIPVTTVQDINKVIYVK